VQGKKEEYNPENATREGGRPELWYRSQNTKGPELRFRALLTDRAREVRFEQVMAG
jgi:hypothetical protein